MNLSDMIYFSEEPQKPEYIKKKDGTLKYIFFLAGIILAALLKAFEPDFIPKNLLSIIIFIVFITSFVPIYIAYKRNVEIDRKNEEMREKYQAELKKRIDYLNSMLK